MEKPDDKSRGRQADDQMTYKSLSEEEQIELLDSSHLAVNYLKKSKNSLVYAENLDPISSLVGSLLNDEREIELHFPFCEKKLCISIKDFFSVYFQVVVKKGRFPEESQYIEAAFQHCATKLTHDTESGKVFLLINAHKKVPMHIIEENIHDSTDPYIIRTKNEFAMKLLPEELWENVFRKKLQSSEERHEKLPEIGVLFPMIHLFEELGKTFKKDFWIVLQMFLLLIDPAYKFEVTTFSFRGEQITVHIRELLSEVIRYDVAVTYYSINLNKDERLRLAEAFTRNHIHIVINALKGVKPDEEPSLEVMGKLRKLYFKTREAIAKGKEIPESTLTAEVEEKWRLAPQIVHIIGETLSEADASFHDVSLWGVLQLLLHSEKKEV